MVQFFLLKRKGKHDSGWSNFDRFVVSCPNPEHVRCCRSRSVALQMDVFDRNMHFFVFFWCLVAGSIVDGSGAQSIHARHGKHAIVQRRTWILMNSFACFSSPSFLVESGKQHA